MRHHLYVHLVWTTRDRAPRMDARVAAFLDPYVRRVAVEERVQVLALGLVRSHVHVLLRIRPQSSLPRLVQRLKGGSAHLASVGGHVERWRPLRWAKGYSMHSVSPRAVQIVREYVLAQPEHHPDDAIAGWAPVA